MSKTSHAIFVCLFTCLTACAAYEGGVNNLTPVKPLPDNEDARGAPKNPPLEKDPPVAPPEKPQQETPAATNFGSCNYPTQKMCLDFQSAEAAENMKTSCAQGGVLSEKESCSAQGKIQGCQMNIQGVKYMTTWAYDAQSKGLVEYSCQAQSSQGDGMSAVLVAP